ncbi:MAG: aldo/keto reductase [Melioribacteraceae bacterium]|nr:aldo/keto reductase [Melioribacteraceae bacterium]
MKYKIFGKSGLRVSELSLGAMTFGEGVEWSSDKETCKKMFDIYTDAGGNFIDTANVYRGGDSEKLVADFIYNNRDYYVLATKYVFNMNPKDPNSGGSHRKNMVQSVEKSLKRLNTDYIDLYWVHRYDPNTPDEELMRGLDDLIRQGKILYVGISDAPAWWVSQVNVLAELKCWSQFIGLQIEYNLLERTIERELLPMAEHFGLGLAAWSPLASGILTGKYNKKEASENKRLDTAKFKEVSKENLEIAATVVDMANETGKSPAQIALNWVRQKSKLVVPIIGARTIEQLQDNIGCLEFELSEEQMKKLNDASEIDLGFPTTFLNRTYDFMMGEKEIIK